MKVTQKTAAIYDRWLFTLGGGEQVAFAYAEMLRDLGYKTTLLTHRNVDTALAEKKMNVNLKGIEIIYLPEKQTQEVSEETEKYDLFINTSYLDYFPNRSKQGILSVFFPGSIFLTPWEYIKRALVVPSLRWFFIYPVHFDNFTFDEYKNGRIYKWLSQSSSILFNQSCQKLSLTFYCETISFAVLENIEFLWGGKKVKPERRILHHRNNMISYVFSLPKAEETLLEIKLPKLTYAKKIALVQLTIPTLSYFAYNVFKKYFPKWEMRLHGGPGVTKLSDLESYHQIITISEFCKKWIKKYWGLSSKILYPPVNTESFYVAKRKKNIIINIGRFFVTGHCKKQLDLVKVFKRMYNTDSTIDWELHFVGSVHDGEKHQQYFQQCEFEAKGYPIHFHTDFSFHQLRDLLAESSIYWHATGLDEDPNTNPIVFEHFGITTVEAMASGCVPVVINRGGQPEIVTKESGFVWETREELMKKTKRLINKPELRKSLQQGAIKRSQYFSREKFRERFQQLVEGKK